MTKTDSEWVELLVRAHNLQSPRGLRCRALLCSITDYDWQQAAIGRGSSEPLPKRLENLVRLHMHKLCVQAAD